MKPCAHVVCKVCVDELVRAAKQCVVCDHTLDDKDIIELKREGVFPCWVPCGQKGYPRSFLLVLIHWFVRHWIRGRRSFRSEKDRRCVPGLTPLTPMQGGRHYCRVLIQFPQFMLLILPSANPHPIEHALFLMFISHY